MFRRFLSSLTLAALAITLAGPAGAQQAAQCDRNSPNSKFPNPWVVHFDSGKTAIKPDEAKRIAETAKLAKTNFVQQVCVSGFADKQGNAEMNQRLSKARADVVAAQLRRNGVTANTIVVESKGEPGGNLAPSYGKAGQADRRVEIRFTK